MLAQTACRKNSLFNEIESKGAPVNISGLYCYMREKVTGVKVTVNSTFVVNVYNETNRKMARKLGKQNWSTHFIIFGFVC